MTDATDKLSVTAVLMGEVLAARHRLGEPFWTFSKRSTQAARRLEEAGLASIWPGIAQDAIRVSLTQAGRDVFLDPGYTPPSPKSPLR